MTGPYGAPSQQGPQGPHGGPPAGAGPGGMGPGQMGPGPQQGWSPSGPGQQGPGQHGPGQQGPGPQGPGQPGQGGPGPRGPQGYGSAPSSPSKPVELDKILGFVAAGAAVLAFFLNFLDFTPGFTYAAFFLVAGILSLAPLLPKAGDHTFLAAVIPVSLFLGLLFNVFQGASYAEVGFWLIFVLALVQAAAAVGVYLIKAGIVNPGAAKPAGPSAGYNQHQGPVQHNQGPGQQNQGPGQPHQGPGQQGPGQQGSGPSSQYGPSSGYGSQAGSSAPGGFNAPSGYGASQYGQSAESNGPDSGATSLIKNSGYGDQPGSGNSSSADEASDSSSSSPSSFSGFAEQASSFAPTQQVNYSQMREEAERAGQSGTHSSSGFSAPSGYGSANDSEAPSYGSAPAGYGAAAPAGAGSQTGPVPTQHDSDQNPGTGPQQVPPGYQSGSQH